MKDMVKPEQQALKQIEQQQIQAQQEASAKVASAKDVTPGTQPAESLSENEKLKLATAGPTDSGAADSNNRIANASEYPITVHPKPGFEYLPNVEQERLQPPKPPEGWRPGGPESH